MRKGRPITSWTWFADRRKRTKDEEDMDGVEPWDFTFSNSRLGRLCGPREIHKLDSRNFTYPRLLCRSQTSRPSWNTKLWDYSIVNDPSAHELRMWRRRNYNRWCRVPHHNCRKIILGDNSCRLRILLRGSHSTGPKVGWFLIFFGGNKDVSKNAHWPWKNRKRWHG